MSSGWPTSRTGGPLVTEPVVDLGGLVSGADGVVVPSGFAVKDGDLPDCLKPFQAAAVRLACRLGRAALFEDCGLGKPWGEGGLRGFVALGGLAD